MIAEKRNLFFSFCQWGLMTPRQVEPSEQRHSLWTGSTQVQMQLLQCSTA